MVADPQSDAVKERAAEGRAVDERVGALDDEVWARLVEMVTAASRGDARAHAVAVVAFSRQASLPGRMHADACLLYLLYHQLKTVLARVPTDDDLRHLARRTYPRFREVVVVDDIHLEDTFRRVLQFPPLGAALTQGEFLLCGSAALGVLLADPLGELEAMRPSLALWITRLLQAFPALAIGG